MLANEVLTVRQVIEQLDPGARDRVVTTLGQAVHAEVAPMVQLLAPMIGSLTGVTCDAKAQAAILHAVVAFLATQLPAHQGQLEAFASERLAVATTLETALTALPKDRFERVLRGIFEEDEWILVALGAVLGGAIGTMQGLLVLAL